MRFYHRTVFLYLTVATIFAAPVLAQTKSTPPHRIQKLAEGVYAAWPPPGSDVGSTSGFIIGKDTVWMFDALRSDVATRLRDEIKKLTPNPVRYIVNSHHHWGLVLGNAAFPEARIVAHARTRGKMIDDPPAAQIARQADTPEEGRAAIARHVTLAVRLPDLAYTDRLIFYDGEREIQIIHPGRAHTDNDSMIYLPAEKILFAGDLLPGLRGPGSQQDAHFQEFIESIDKVLAMDVETIVPGRGDKLGTKQDLRQFRQHLVTLMSDVKKYVDRGATLEETEAGVKPSAYIDPARLPTKGFKYQWSVIVERAYAELRGEPAAKGR
jgi:cyclase